jgi:hypothetical protein
VEKAGTWGGTAGHWQANSGFLSGFKETADIPTLSFRETLPAEFDLNMSISSNADNSWVGILLSDGSRRREYVFCCGWGMGIGADVTVEQNLRFGREDELAHPPATSVADLNWRPPERRFDCPSLSLSLGRVYRLTWIVRAAGIDFTMDGKPVARIPDPVPATSMWRLTLEDCYPITHVESGRRHRVLPPDSSSPYFEVIEEEHGAVVAPGAAPPQFSAIEVRVPSGDAKRIAGSVKP